MANPYPGLFSPGQCIGWALGPAVGLFPVVVAQLIFLLFPEKFSPTEVFWLTTILTVAGAFLGGGAGYFLSFLFDDDRRDFFLSEFRYAFLFGLVGAVLIYSLLTFPLLSLLAQTKIGGIQIILPLAAFVAGLVPAGANGVINNMRYRSDSGPPALRGRATRSPKELE